MDFIEIWEFLQQDNNVRGGGSSTEDRITEDGETRFTENDLIRILE